MGLGPLYADFKTFQINLTKSSLTYVAVGEIAVGFLIVAGIVLPANPVSGLLRH